MTFFASRDDDGIPRVSELDAWQATCNGCGTRKHVAKIRRWFVGPSTTSNTYCPRCKRDIERTLIRSALGAPLPRSVALWRCWAIRKASARPKRTAGTAFLTIGSGAVIAVIARRKGPRR